MYETLLLEKSNGVATITLNKPEALNAMDLVMRAEFYDLLTALAQDEEVGAVLLTGAGRAFCAGGDISGMGNSRPNAGRKRMQRVQRVTRAIMELEKPVLAAVNGPCAGSGLALALASDIVLCSDKARFGLAFLKIGLVPDLGTFFLLPRKVGLLKAKELVLLSEMFDAAAAREMGLVSRVLPHEELMGEARAVAEKLARGPRIAMGLSKLMLNKSYETDLERSLLEEAFAQDLCMLTEDFEEGIAAFREKRKPFFQGK
jgi:2-(1,2-epoxy-1,2-dihydrophenyl)acetyl-CoA isomerase